MLQVNHDITIGASSYSPKQQTQLMDLQAIASLAIPVNSCRLVLGHPETVKVAPKDPVTVKLGDGNNSTLVFTGIVGSVEWGIDRVMVYAVGAFQSLILARFNLLYEKPNAGDIVKDIIQSRLKLGVAKIENGGKFLVYALGDRISAYDHLQQLSHKSGFDFYANTQDKVIFAQYKATKTHELTYGSNILTWHLQQPLPGVTGIEIYGESPSSQGQGEQAYTWLTKKEVKGSAGNRSGGMLRLDDPTVRTQDSASKVAQAILENRQQKQRGRIKSLGDPNIQLGDAVKVVKMPLSQQNGTFKIIGITHRLNRHRGFCTIIDWEEA